MCVYVITHTYNITVWWCHHFNKVSVILAYLFPCPLARENRLLAASIGISRLPASSPPSLGYMRQKEYPRDSSTCHSSCPRVPNQSAFFSLPFKVYFYVKCLEFLVVLSIRDREKLHLLHLPRSGNPSQFYFWSNIELRWTFFFLAILSIPLTLTQSTGSSLRIYPRGIMKLDWHKVSGQCLYSAHWYVFPLFSFVALFSESCC